MALVLPDYDDDDVGLIFARRKYSRHLVSITGHIPVPVIALRLPTVILGGTPRPWNWAFLRGRQRALKSGLKALDAGAAVIQLHVSKPPRMPAPSNFNANPEARAVVGLWMADCLGCPTGSRYVPSDPASLQSQVSPNNRLQPGAAGGLARQTLRQRGRTQDGVTAEGGQIDGALVLERLVQTARG